MLVERGILRTLDTQGFAQPVSTELTRFLSARDAPAGARNVRYLNGHQPETADPQALGEEVRATRMGSRRRRTRTKTAAHSPRRVRRKAPSIRSSTSPRMSYAPPPTRSTPAYGDVIVRCPAEWIRRWWLRHPVVRSALRLQQRLLELPRYEGLLTAATGLRVAEGDLETLRELYGPESRLPANG